MTTQTSNNTADNHFSQISGDYVVWQGDADGDSEIYLYQIRSGTTMQISNNLVADVNPQIDGNYVVWLGLDENRFSEIYLAKIRKSLFR